MRGELMHGDADLVSEADWSAAVEAMRAAGRAAGKAGGSWVADGNTSRLALEGMLRALEGDADPDACAPPMPFSGEWADAATLEETVDAETELDAESLTPEELDELGTAFEDEYAAAWLEEAERTVRALLGD